MKKTLLTLFSIILISYAASAQHCAAASTSITPHVGTAPGLSPSSDMLACGDSGTFVSDTIYFKNFSSFSGFTVNSLTIDSINNLPAGLCWVSNKPTNSFTGGEDGIIYVSGICGGNPGQYKLRIHITANIQLIGTQSGDAEALAGLRYYVRVKCPSASCTAVDTTLGKTQAFIPYAHCSNTTSGVTASITPAGPVVLCPGTASTTLTANSGTNYTYNWNTGATTPSISATPGSSYIVTVHSGVDSAVSNTVVVSTGTAPDTTVTHSGSTAICFGDSVCLTAAAGLTYHWSDFAGSTTRTICVRFPGSYKVTVTNSNNCTAVSNPITVALNQGPSVTVTRNGNVLTATSTATHFQWNNGMTPLPDTTNTLTITQNGTYVVFASNPGGCRGVPAVITVNNLGILDLYEHSTLAMYPNPTTGMLTVATATLQGAILTVYDHIGRVVKQQTISLDKTVLDLSTESEGIYIVSVKSQDAIATTRIVVLK